MIINHNLQADNAIRNMNINSNAAAKAMAKLSSGLRINSAADDAAGLAISEKMKGQVNGLNQASSNAQNGISMVQTAEGALNETTSILQRMRQLAVQSSSDTNTSQDRSNIQSEVTQLQSEIDRIGNTTQFNTKNLIDGSMGKGYSAATANINTSSIFETTAGALVGAGQTLSNLGDASGKSLNIVSGDTVKINWTKNGALQTASMTVSAADTISTITAKITDATLSVQASGALNMTAAANGTSNAVEGILVTFTSKATGTENTAATNAFSSFTETKAAEDQKTDGSATVLIGANSGQSLNIAIDDMRSQALGVANLNLSTQAGANQAIKVIDNATQRVSAQRANLGALQNRLDHTINNLGTESQNLQSAQSQIADVDMASEMSNYSKENVLTQAAQSMLYQANQQPQQVLQLLR